MAAKFCESPSKVPRMNFLYSADVKYQHLDLLCDISKEILDRDIKYPVDFLKDIEENYSSALICGNCEEDALAVARCKDCDELLCKHCMQAHGRVKLTKDHCIITLSDDNHLSQLSPSSSESGSINFPLNFVQVVSCSFHPKENNEFYCNSCCAIFCFECNSLEHNGHSYIPLNEALESAQSASSKYLTEAKLNAMTIMENIEISQRMQDSLGSHCQIITKEIKNIMRRFHMAIEARESELIEKLKTILLQKSAAIQNQITTFRILHSSFSQAACELSDVLDSGEPTQIIEVRDNVSEKLKRLRSMRSSMIQVDDTLKVIPPDWSLLLAISSMGDVTGDNKRFLEHSVCDDLLNNISKSHAFNQNAFGDVSNFKIMPPSSVKILRKETSLLHRISESSSNESINSSKLTVKPKSIQRDYLDVGIPSLVIGGEGDADGKLCRPWGVCCSSDGKIIVADRSNNRIQVFDPEGKFLFKFGIHGSSPGCFDRPAGVTTDTYDRIIVADKDNHRIQVFTKNGVFIFTFGEKGSKVGQFNYPWDVATDQQRRIAVSDSRNHRIQLFDFEGTFIAKYGFDTSPHAIKQFDSPRGVCFTSNGYVIATDFNNHRLVVIDPNFRNARFIGTEGSAEKQFSRPQGIAVDGVGNIIVADSRNNRIQIFEQKGNFICAFGSLGKEANQMDRPSGLCISPTGKIVVVDFGNNRVQVF